MSYAKRLEVAPSKFISVYKLREGEVFSPTPGGRVIVSRSGRTWHRSWKDKLYASNFGGLRVGKWAGNIIEMRFLSKEDIEALGKLGVLSAERVTKALEQAAWKRIYEGEFDTLKEHLDSLRASGVVIRSSAETVIREYAKKRATEMHPEGVP